MDELLGRKIPYSAQAEQAVIGSMLIDPKCIPNVMEQLKADEFYSKLNRDIYETIYAMFSYGQTIDPVTVLEQMKIRGVYQENCENYMAEVMHLTPTANNVLEYAVIVRDRALLRRLAEGDSYGYRLNKQIAEISEENLELKEATLYTAFRRLEEAGLIRAYWGDEATGARRRYYTLTPAGQQRLLEEAENWKETRRILEKLIVG